MNFLKQTFSLTKTLAGEGMFNNLYILSKDLFIIFIKTNIFETILVNFKK